MTKPITRKQYLDGEATHREYYAQFVDGHTRATVRSCIGMEKLLASDDRAFNDIRLGIWDIAATQIHTAIPFTDTGDYCTLSGQVCVAKEAARQLVEGSSS